MPHLIHLAMSPPRFITKGGICLTPKRCEPRPRFVWPLGRLGNREPCVLATHGGDRRGIVLGYPTAPIDRELYVPVFASNDGEVSCALEGSSGGAISIDHGGTWSTHYTGLSKLCVAACKPRSKRRQHVRAGEVMGFAATLPTRIGFELWRWTEDLGFVAVEPLAHMSSWAGAPASFSEPAQEAA